MRRAGAPLRRRRVCACEDGGHFATAFGKWWRKPSWQLLHLHLYLAGRVILMLERHTRHNKHQPQIVHLELALIERRSKVYCWSLNYCRCVIPVHELLNWRFRSANLLNCAILTPALISHLSRFSNFFICITLVPKFGFESHTDQNRENLKKL
jgi:hypothetical protein